MSNNYNWYSITSMIDCQSFKACYQICRQLKRHGFCKAYETTMGNTRILSYIKNETEIVIYIYNELREPLTGHKICFNDYIQSLAKRYTERHRASLKG